MKIRFSLVILSLALLVTDVRGQLAVGTSTVPAVYDIPGAGYAVFNVSGNIDETYGPQALDDQNNVAFTNLDPTAHTLTVYGWTNGSTSQLQSFSLIGDTTYLPDPNSSIYQIRRTSSLNPTALTASGKVYGSRYLHYLSTGAGQLEEYSSSFVSVNGTITNLDGDPVNTWPDQTPGLASSGYSVYFAAGDDWAGPITKTDPSGITDLGFTYINHAGSYNYFSAVGSNSFYTITASGNLFPAGLNTTGWLISNSYGDSEVLDGVWNGTALLSLPFSPQAVNDQGLVIGYQQIYSDYTLIDSKGYLAVPGPNSTVTSIKLTDLLGQSTPFKQWVSQMSWVYPLLISNRNSTTGEVHILFTAIAPISSWQPALTNQAFVLTLDSNNQPTKLAPLRVSSSIRFPSSLGQAFTSINSSGVVLAIGQLSPTDSIFHTLLLVPFDLTIYSNQISGVQCNKLPTGLPFKSLKQGVVADFNNPMIMGTQYGYYGSVAVIVNGASGIPLTNYFVGVRKAGSSAILGYAPAQVGPTPTYVYFNASPGINAANFHAYYEVVVGYDANGNGVLDPGEVVYEFGDQDSAAETSPQDKIIVVENDDYQDSISNLKLKVILTGIPYPNASELLKTLINPAHIPNGATATTFTLYSNDPDLKCPVGAYWTQSGTAGMDTANFYTFSTGSAVANKVENSKTFQELLYAQMDILKPTVEAYFTANPSATTYTSSVISFSQTIHFSVLEKQFSDLNLAWGTVPMTGHMQVTVQNGMLGGLSLSNVYYDASFNDITNFWISANKATDFFQLSQHAAPLQAGYGTLGTAGRVFESNVNFSNTKQAAIFGFPNHKF